MYKIQRRPTGYILTFSGTIEPNEMQKWCDESAQLLSTEVTSSFGVIIDMKDLEPLSSASNALLVKGQKLYKDKGMNRSAVLLSNAETCSKLKSIAIQSGIYATERYINASEVENAPSLAVNWVKDGIDPDSK